MAPEAVRKALEAGVRAWCNSATSAKDKCNWPHCVCWADRYDLDIQAAIAAFLRALPRLEDGRIALRDVHDLAAAVDAASTTREEGT